MKKLSLFSLALFIGLFSASVMGQNKCTVGNTTITCSEDYQLIKKSESSLWMYKPTKHQPQDTGNRELFNLTIEPTFNGEFICISDGADYKEVLQESSVSLDLAEGHYDIVVIGYTEDHVDILLSYAIDLHEDTTLQPDASEAIHPIYAEGVDENGQDLNTVNVFEYNTRVLMDYVWFDQLIRGYNLDVVADMNYRFNEIPENSYFQVVATFQVLEENKSYLMLYDRLNPGSDGHTTNHVEDIASTYAFFNLDNVDSALYHTNFRCDNGKGWMLSTNGWHIDEHYDATKPMKIVTNAIDTHPGEFEENEWKYRIIPLVWESVDAYSQVPNYFSDKMTFSAMSLNADRQFVREPFDDILNNVYTALYHQSLLNHYPLTPAMMVEDPEQIRYYGFRTPIWHWQGFAFGEDSPAGVPFYGGVFCAFGEGGVQRCTDEDNELVVKLDGETIYQDYIYEHNEQWSNAVPEIGVLTFDIEDNHAVNNGMVMGNRTHVELDLSKEEALPPTLTILQVMDENNTEKIDIHDLAHSRINIAAGIFIPDFETIRFMLYHARPEMEVWYSMDGGAYQPLEVVEDETMFHEFYGNFFVVDLAQLEGIANDKWVSLKVKVTDAYGNFQTQELDNLFYAGAFESIENHETPTVQHQVYPNPFTNEVCIKTSEAIDGAAVIEIYNVVGEKVFSQRLQCNQSHEFRWNGNNEGSGLYFYKITTEQGVISGSIIKE